MFDNVTNALKLLATALILFAVFLVGCKEKSSIATNDEAAHFVFGAENISSWKEVEHGFSITLTEAGKQELFALTSENLRKPIKIYVETLLVSSPRVAEPLRGGKAMLAVDPDMRKNVILLLPPEKRDNGEFAVTEITFSDIELTQDTIKQYPFLRPLKDEIEENKVRFRPWIEGDLKHENVEFSPPQVAIAKTRINNQNVTISAVAGGEPNIYCGHAGCSYSFYNEQGDTYSFIQGLTLSGPLYQASCPEGQYFVFGGGPGMSAPHYVVWSLHDGEMTFRKGVSEQDSSICND